MKKKTILITGATSGIGLGCARKFAENGDRIILNGRNIEKLETIRQELEAKGTEVLVLAFDVRDREASKKAIENGSRTRAGIRRRSRRLGDDD